MRKISFILAFLISGILVAQDTFEGTIKYDITYEDLAEQLVPMKSMLPKNSEVMVKGDMSKVETPNGMGGETVVITDAVSGDVLTLMNQMGNKFALKTNTKEVEDDEDTSVEYMDDDTKEILGYTCKKAIVTNGDNEVEVYYTEELSNIKFSGNAMKVKGFPMQIIMSQEMFTMTQTVASIEEGKVKKIKMEVPSEYELKTLDELKKMGGGM